MVVKEFLLPPNYQRKKQKKKLLHVALGAVNVAVALLKHPLKHIKLDLNTHVYVFL